MLIFNLKKQWFDKIKSGEKTHEYREAKYYWTSRFVNEFFEPKNKQDKKDLIEIFRVMLKTDFLFKNNNCKICFMNGMKSEEERQRMYAKLKSIKIVNGKNTDLAIDKDVYDIEFELIKENNNVE